MTQLKIMFPFYGAKFQYAKRYPAPQYGSIIEPFAGAAGYSLRYPDRNITLLDSDPVIASVWNFLITAPESDVRKLPLLEPGQAVSSLGVCPEAAALIGFWVNPGSAIPKATMSAFAAQPDSLACRVWGAPIRERIASQQQFIRHWAIKCADYSHAPAVEATWFIDPPYRNAGQFYRHGSKGIDYGALAQWVNARAGQVICCEDQDADWLPFEPLFETGTNAGNSGKLTRRFKEAIYHRPGPLSQENQ